MSGDDFIPLLSDDGGVLFFAQLDEEYFGSVNVRVYRVHEWGVKVVDEFTGKSLYLTATMSETEGTEMHLGDIKLSGKEDWLAHNRVMKETYKLLTEWLASWDQTDLWETV